MIKEIPRQTQQAHHWQSLLPSSSEQSPFHPSTETNPGHLSRTGSNFPLCDIVLVHHDPQCPIPIPWVNSLSPIAYADYQPKCGACTRLLLASLRSTVPCVTWKAPRQQASQPFTFLTSRSTVHIPEVHMLSYETIIISHLWDRTDVLCHCKNNAQFPYFKLERNWSGSSHSL